VFGHVSRMVEKDYVQHGSETFRIEVNELIQYPGLLDDEFDEEPCASIEDACFDQIYPSKVQKLSWRHWTPVTVAVEAAKLLVTEPRTRVLDVGCGPGKFCLVAAALTDARLTGIEQRSDLVAVARRAALQHRLTNVEIVHGNVTDFAFAGYNAFYLFNPFEENVFQRERIDSSVPLSEALFQKYTHYVAAQLGNRPIGTRVVTYAGTADEIPACYDCEQALFGDELKLWIKTRDYAPEEKRGEPNDSPSPQNTFNTSPRNLNGCFV
jgi:SAM-dependent methyltransferase